ncbi:MAG: tetratricopeptide repeat protein [Elusimicrobia bacterium]|nr:tetratricopeptide repeat protein [Elusimicrobiota bacterium]
MATRAAALALLLCAAPCRADSFPSWSAKAQKARARHDEAAELQAWSRALQLWKASNGKRPKSAALARRAQLREKAGDWREALDDLSAALELDAKNASLFCRRGRLRLDRGMTSEALSDLYKATALDPARGEAFFDRGRAYEILGDAKFSREDFRIACRLGIKPACARPAAPKAGPPPADPPAPTPPAQPGPKTPAAAAPAPQKDIPVDFGACMGQVKACADGGESFGTCVERTRLCGPTPETGCCPPECIGLFHKLANAKSEAQAFRETFRPGSACLHESSAP